MHFVITLIFAFPMVASVAGNQTVLKSYEDKGFKVPNSSKAISFYVKEPFKVVEKENHVIPWSSSVMGVKSVEVNVEDKSISVISGHEEFFHPSVSSITEYFFDNETLKEPILVEGYINMSAKFIGYNKIFVTLRGSKNEILAKGTLNVAVMLLAQYLTKVYQICLTVILIIVYTNMGTNLDLELVKMIIKKPFGPTIGLFCQFVCMPLIAFSLGLLIFPDEPLFRLGLFASGSSPGGGLSNMWTHLLGGSLDLSVMMTFTSTVVALGAVPFWLLTLGSVIVGGTNFVIPYANVLAGIVILILPCFVGIMIQLKFPRTTKIMRLLLTPLSLFNILFIFSFGVYTNFYLFSYLTWKAVGAGFGQSLCGHLAGILIALLFRRSLKEVIAISIETAVQNNGIAFLLLKMSLDKPAGDLAVLLPGCVGLFMPVPLLLALLIKIFYEKIYSSKFIVNGSEKDKPTENGELKERNKETGSNKPEEEKEVKETST